MSGIVLFWKSQRAGRMGTGMEEKRVTRELDAEMSKQAWIRVKDKPKYNARWYRVHRPCPSGQGRFFILFFNDAIGLVISD